MCRDVTLINFDLLRVEDESCCTNFSHFLSFNSYKLPLEKEWKLNEVAVLFCWYYQQQR